MNENLDLIQLRAVAEAATPGPWETLGGQGPFGTHAVCHRMDQGTPVEIAYRDAHFDKANAVHIATFDPPTVLALLSRLEQAEQALGAAERQIAARTGETAAERIWRNRAEQAEQQVARVHEFSRKMLQPHGQNVVVAARVVESLDRALDGDHDA